MSEYEEGDDKENDGSTEITSEESGSTSKEGEAKKLGKARLKSKRKKVEDKELELIRVISSSLSESSHQANKVVKKAPEEELCDTFGSYVSQTLFKLDMMTRSIAQHKISEVLFQAQVGMLGLTNSMLTQPVSLLKCKLSHCSNKPCSFCLLHLNNYCQSGKCQHPNNHEL